MHEHEDLSSLPDVSTEPQRQALDEMSRQLVERLNDMVQEQHERASRFAAMQHSLSPLPGLPETEAQAAAPAPPAVAAAPAVTPPTHRKGKRPPALPPRPALPKEPQVFEEAPEPEDDRTDWLKKIPTKPDGKKEGEESGCGTFPTIVAIIIIVILLRACS